AMFGLVSTGASFIQGRNPALLQLLATEVLSFLPLLALGVVLIAGVMFELSSTSRFATSDAANWLPITPVEYVAASSIAATFVYSITLALALGAGLGLAVASGLVGAFALAALLSGLALFLGGLLIEILRATTQRISSLVGRRTGRATVVLRMAIFLLVILAFQFTFNPIFLLQILGSLGIGGNYALVVPLLWPSRAVVAVLDGQYLLAAALSAADVAFIGLVLYLAALVRSRYWAPSPQEFSLEAHRYARRHGWLAGLGLSSTEASLVSKDFRGLVRRKELVPILLTPVVIAIFSLVSTLQSPGGGGRGPAFGIGLLVAWIPGFFALLLATTSFGQERRAIQTLFSLPIAAGSIFRAKAASALLPALAFGLAFWVLEAVVFRPGLSADLALLAVVGAVVVLGTFLGLAFASRYSDFQDRPRPQFLRPLPMMGAMLSGVGLIFGIALPVLFWVLAGAPLSALGLASLAISFGVAAVATTLCFGLARSGTERFLRQVPV
ncbi:MAG TPA: hypothetical protein VIZ68_01460, partial [Thermoplasmata archaeon]